MIELEIKVLNRENIDEQVQLYHEAYGFSQDFNEIKDFWIKKHYSNPIQNSYISGAFVDGKLVGMQACMPILYWIGGHKVMVIQPADTCVAKDFRRLGISHEIFSAQIDYFKNKQYALMISFPTYETTHGDDMKQGFTHIKNIDNYYFIINSHNYLKNSRKLRWWRVLPSWCKRQKIKLYGAFYKAEKTYDIKEIDIAEWNIKHAENAEIHLDESEAFLKWKADYLDLKTIGFFYNDVPVGKCSYKVVSVKNTTHLWLQKAELDENFSHLSKAFVSLLLVYFIKKYKNAIYMRMWLDPDDPLYLDFKKLTIPLKERISPFNILPLNADFSNDAIVTPSAWHISRMDVDC